MENWIDELSNKVEARIKRYQNFQPFVADFMNEIARIVKSDIQKVNTEIYENSPIFNEAMLSFEKVSDEEFYISHNNSEFTSSFFVDYLKERLQIQLGNKTHQFRVMVTKDRKIEIFDAPERVSYEEISKMMIEPFVLIDFNV